MTSFDDMIGRHETAQIEFANRDRDKEKKDEKEKQKSQSSKASNSKEKSASAVPLLGTAGTIG